MTSAELYNPSTGVWQHTGTLATARVLVSDGSAPQRQCLSGWRASSAANMTSWPAPRFTTTQHGHLEPTGSLATARKNFQMVVLPTGNVLAAGGVNNMAQYLASAEVYNYTMGSWPATGTLMTARSDFQMAVF